MAQAVTYQVIFQQIRSPPIYHGDVFEDVQDWLQQFEDVALFNQWDPQQKLSNVYYVLEAGARTWFQNPEASLSTWDVLCQQLLETFWKEFVWTTHVED